MADRVPKDMPCKTDCPDRYPGCFCDKKKAYDEKKRKEKAKIRAHKARQSMLDEFGERRKRK